MKKFNLLTGLTAATILIFVTTGCKKDNNSSGGGGISATINGTGWQSQPLYTTAVHSGGTTTLFGGFIKGTDSSVIGIQFHDSLKVNTPDNLYLSDLLYSISNSGNEKLYGASHGTVTLTIRDENGKRVAGTFSGVLYTESQDDSVKIENGHFNVTYIEE